ncbi:3-methyl-2-oxobutanoate hydroxymethyltransferase [Desulfoplanes formicivorans]|uniref:3-methyl-2-oxobutanoate hydroxymethyltransferase n=1 Tax=Desulfoplanes formicivorans TaxID=1592317 RepID=A0A194AFM0_9BACT|nr:3-methyl-2-oxobutanoate hydroxymethyltransferase [Desulfoplanes formicivorans]GAU08872.1 3-methyl-2-oxobutanoate hydroxymethyltransferase [Desulfoplanes formicivorans]
MATKMTLSELAARKTAGRKITMVTAYDYPTARLVDKAGLDMILVGDSLGMVVLGYDSTVPVTMEDMLHHIRAVMRGTQRAFVLGDLPFMSYQVSVEQAVGNAGRFIKEGGCDGVKLEGGREVVPQVQGLCRAGIPVCGHIGLTPQTATNLGGFKVQGKDAASASALVEDALALQEAGAFMLVLECVPDILAREISRTLHIPTIGIGAGRECDGQVLVFHDLVGLFDRFTPKFVKRYAQLEEVVVQALQEYGTEVAAGIFPGPEHCFGMKQEEADRFVRTRK